MPIRIPRSWEIPEHEVTERALFENRRRFILGAGAALALGPCAARAAELPASGPLNYQPSGYGRGEDLTPRRYAISYNNFYEFGTDKEDPAREAHRLRTRPWSITVGGACERPGVVDVETLFRPHRLEERIYRFRCVEAWSMVVPWVGVPLKDVLARFRPLSKARYVAFTTLHDPKQMPGQRRDILPWPYREGLRMDEAMHPLAFLAVGMYGEVLPNQNGAPVRLVVPWKYGFKSIKSIVAIDFVERQPETTWSRMAPDEYGFYANVNPAVDHPRWSQKRERRLGEWGKRPTLPFNGYGDEVAGLYAGMDLRRYF